MPYLRLPDGSYTQVPEGMSYDVALDKAKRAYPDLFGIKPTFGGQLAEIPGGLVSGFVGSFGQAARGIGALLPEETEKSFAEGTESIVNKLSPTAAPGYEDTVGRKLSEALGSVASFFIPGAGVAGLAAKGLGAGVAATRLGTAAVGALGVASSAGEARTRAEKEGATPEQRRIATLEGAPVGLLEMLPAERLLGSLGKETLGGLVAGIKRASVTGGFEAAQEVASNAAQNLIAKTGYKPEQAILEGSAEAGGYGFGAGAITQALLDLAIGRRGGGARTVKPVTPATPEEERRALFEQAPVSPQAPVQADLFGGPTTPLVRTEQEPTDVMGDYRNLKRQLNDVETALSAARDQKDLAAYSALQPQYALLQRQEKQLLAVAKQQGISGDELNLTPDKLVQKLQKKIETKMDKGEALGELPKLLERAKARVAPGFEGTLFDPAELQAQQERETAAIEAQRPDFTAAAPELRGAETRDLFEQGQELTRGIKQSRFNETRAAQQVAFADTEAMKRAQRMAVDAPIESILFGKGVGETVDEGFRNRITRLQTAIDAGRITPEVKRLLDLTLPDKATFNLTDPAQAAIALRAIEARKTELEYERKTDFPNREVIKDGQLTQDGKRLVGTDAALAELERLASIARDTQAKQPPEGKAQALVSAIERQATKLPIKPSVGLPRVEIERRATGYGKQVDKLLFNLTDLLDEMRKGEKFGGTNVAAASETMQAAQRRAEILLSRLKNRVLEEAAHRRAAGGFNPITQDEAIKSLLDIQIPLQRLIRRAAEPRTKPTTLTLAMKKAGVKAPKEDVIKRGFSREEFAKVTQNLKAIRDSLASPTRTLAKGPFDLTPQTPEHMSAKERYELGLKPSTPLAAELLRRREALQEKIRGTLAKQNIDADVRTALQEAVNVLEDNRGSREFMATVENIRDRADTGLSIDRADMQQLADQMRLEQQSRENLLAEGQQELFGGTLSKAEQARREAGARLEKKREQKKNLTGAKRLVEKTTEEAAGLRKAVKEAGAPGLGLETATIRATPANLQRLGQTRKLQKVVAPEAATAPSQRALQIEERKAAAKERQQQEAQRKAEKLAQAKLAAAKIKGLAKKEKPMTAEERKAAAKEIAMQGAERRARKEGRLTFAQLDDSIKKFEAQLKNVEGAEAKRIQRTLKKLRGQRDALRTLERAGGVKKQKAAGNIPADVARKGSEDFKKRVSMYEEAAPEIPADVLAEMKSAARGKTLTRLYNEGLAKRKEMPDGSVKFTPKNKQATELYKQYYNEYLQKEQDNRLKAIRAKKIEQEFALPEEDALLERFNYLFREPTGGTGKGVDLAQAAKVIEDVRSKLPKGINFVYAPTTRDVPVSIMKKLERDGYEVLDDQGKPAFSGAVMPDGTVLVIGEAHNNIADLQETIAHELIGHYSVETLLGPQGMQKFVDELFSRPGGEDYVFKLAATLNVYSDVAETQQAMIRAGANANQVRLAMVREMIAHASEGRPVPQSALEAMKDFWRQIVTSVRNFFSGIGMNDIVKQDNRAIQKLIKDAYKAYASQRIGAQYASNGDVVFKRKALSGEASWDEANALRDVLLGGEKKLKDRISAKNWGLQWATEYVDRLAPVEKISSRMEDANAATQMMYDLRMHDQRMSFTSAVASTGRLVRKQRVDENTNAKYWTYDVEDDANLKQIAQILGKASFGNASQNEDYFTMYMAGLRAEQVGFDKLNYEKDVQQQVRDFMRQIRQDKQNLAVFDEARAVYNKYNNNLISFVEQAGAISKDKADALRAQKDYIPFYRPDAQGNVNLFLDDETAFRVGDLKTQPYLQELVGDNRSIFRIFDSAIMNTNMLVDMGLRNQATKNTAFTLQALGLGKINKGNTAGTNVLRFKDHGAEKYFVVDTKGTAFEDIPPDLLVKGMEGVATLIPSYVQLLSKPATLLRKMVTLSPTYAMNQVIKDSVAMNFTSGANNVPVLSALKEVGKMFANKSTGEDALRRSGVMSSKILTGSKDDFATILRQISDGGGFSPIAFMENVGMKADAASRVNLYNSFLDQGLNEMEARLAALEAVNFTKRGVSPTMFHLNMMIPFFNAGIQGINVVAKAFKGTMPFNDRLKVREKLWTRGTMMAAFTMIYAAALAEQDWYKEIPEEDKLRYWFVKLPNVETPIRIPIPFEVGLIFKAVPEAVVRAASNDKDAKPVLSALAKLGGSMLPMAPENLLPAGVKPIIEVAFNESFYTDRPIEGKREEALDPAERFRANTTELAKALGAVGGVSPLKIDHLIRGYTGGLGLELTAMLNPLLGGGAKPEAPEKRLTDIPVIRAFFEPIEGRAIIDRAYEFMDDASRKESTFKKLVEEGRDAEAQAYLDKYAEEISYGKSAAKFKQTMGKITEAERTVRADPVMSPKEKRKMLDDLRLIKTDTARAYASAAF